LPQTDVNYTFIRYAKSVIQCELSLTQLIQIDDEPKESVCLYDKINKNSQYERFSLNNVRVKPVAV